MKGVLGLFLLINLVAVLAVLNPWSPLWQRSGVLVLVVEVATFALVGVPAVAYQVLRKRKSLRDSLRDTTRWVLDFLSGWA